MSHLKINQQLISLGLNILSHVFQSRTERGIITANSTACEMSNLIFEENLQNAAIIATRGLVRSCDAGTLTLSGGHKMTDAFSQRRPIRNNQDTLLHFQNGSVIFKRRGDDDGRQTGL